MNTADNHKMKRIFQNYSAVFTMAAVKDFITAMQKLYIEGAGTDITLVCQGSRKAAHAAVLMAR